MTTTYSLEDVGLDEPVPLRKAVGLFFPHGGASVSTLRTEADKGRLVIERELAVFCEFPHGASRSGRGGRRFKSCHSDQYLAEIQHPSRTVIRTDTSGTHAPAKGARLLTSEQSKTLQALGFSSLRRFRVSAPSPKSPQIAGRNER